jgi:2-amino-4-hydroxy-6-hydroxymethyldihydropteridine diphosphokinase
LKTVYLGLGSNLGDRQANLNAAIDALNSQGVAVRRVSPVYETAPLDYLDQDWFLNLVVEAETTLFPMQLLSRVKRIERALGRRRTVAKGPRIIDLDILFYGRAVVHSSALDIPHPRLAERRFVLAPLADLAPDLRHPVTHRTVRQMLEAVSDQQVRRAGP